jgi:molybdopterin synthase sulfur carrier subunit
MEVEVRYFATLRSKSIKKETIELTDGITARELLQEINIKEEDVAILLVNGIISKFDTEIHNNYIISLFPPVGGG